MEIRKVLAGGLAAAAAGATLAFGAFADLGSYVQVSGSTLASPIIVVGTQTANIPAEYPNDILGAADIAAAVAGYATTPITVGGGTTVSVTDGVDIATSNTKIYFADNIGTKSGLRTTLTRTNLPTLLAQGTFLDAAGTSYTYNQYVNIGAGTVSFGTSGGDLTDPKLNLNTGTSTSSPLYNLTIVFNKVLNVTNSDVRGQTIELFGRSYTIGSTSVFLAASGDKLVLFGGAGNSQTIAEGQEVDIAVSGVTHKVKVVGASSSTQAVISVDGTSKEVTEGNTYTIAGVDVFIESVYYFGKESQLSQVKLSLGSSKITLEQGAAVKVGQTEDTIDGTLVTLTGSSAGISKVEISVTAKDSSTDYILAGGAFSDPVFGGLKIAFGGLNTGTTETITVDNSGTTAASLKFTSYGGNEKSITWAVAPASGTFSADLNSTTTRAYHVIEGETVSKNDYVLLAPSQESEFGHIFEYSAASSLGSSGAYIELKDVMSGDTTRVYLTGTDGGGTATSATFYIDGQSYYVENASTLASQKMVFTWGAGAGSGTAGNYTAFPLIKTKTGGYVTLIPRSASMGTTGAGYYYQLPGDLDYHNISDVTASVAAGRLTYYFADGGSTATLISINQTGGSGVTLTTAPAVLIYEEKGKDTNDADKQNAVILTVLDGAGSNTDVTVQTPVLTDGSAASFTSQQTDNSVTETYDRYGVHVTYDTDGQGLVTVVYPDDQATAMVAAGSDPKFSTAGTGGTYNSAVKIQNPVAKFDTEVSTALTADVILIGGPCANSLVGTLLSSTENTLCSSDANGFITKYPNGMIKEVANAFSSGKKALIVAGVNGAQTRSLASRVMTGTTAYPA